MRHSLLLLTLLASSLWAQESATKYLPEVHGTLRSKYEYQTSIGAGRFEVRNARVSLSGHVLPTVSYKAEIDLSDEGEIKMKDAYARINPWQGVALTAGQMRVPFTIDAHRSPHRQYFANRSFIAKQVANIRDVGLSLRYQCQPSFPLILEAGLFNGSGVSRQEEWRKSPSYSAKAQLFPLPGWNVTLSLLTIKPQQVAIHSYDVGTYVEAHGLHLEGEYLYKRYSDGAYHDVHVVNSMANYDIRLRRGPFQKMSLLMRYDWMTSQSDGKLRDEESQALITTDHARHRLTGGLTLSLGEAFRTDLRLNYEKYFYGHGAVAKVSEQDKVVVELMVRF